MSAFVDDECDPHGLPRPVLRKTGSEIAPGDWVVNPAGFDAEGGTVLKVAWTVKVDGGYHIGYERTPLYTCLPAHLTLEVLA